MSTYENAPATKILATFCACCARPLLDAVSVETGVGPECRKKHGFADAQGEPNWRAVVGALEGFALGGGTCLIPDADAEALDTAYRFGGVETRKIANLLVHRVATTVGANDLQTAALVAALVEAIRALGFTTLAARIVKRLAAVTIRAIGPNGQTLEVDTPYSPEAVDALRKVPGRRWDRERKVNTFPTASKRELFAALSRAFPGLQAVGPKGLFVIPAVA